MGSSKTGILRFIFETLITGILEYYWLEDNKVDIFMIDDPRTQGDKTFFNKMFEAIEQIKNKMIKTIFFLLKLKGKYFIKSTTALGAINTVWKDFRISKINQKFLV